jgi:hypothetical protein
MVKSQEHTLIVNVISGGLTSEGDTKQAHRSYPTQQEFPSVMNIEKKYQDPRKLYPFPKRIETMWRGLMMMSLSFP